MSTLLEGIQTCRGHDRLCAWWQESGGCVMFVCLCLLRVISWFGWEGGLLHSVGHHGKSGRTTRYNCALHLWIWTSLPVPRTHCVLTVRCCSSVEEQLSWLDYNGKHKVRLVNEHRTGDLPDICHGLCRNPSFVWQLSELSFYWWSSTLVMGRFVQLKPWTLGKHSIVLIFWRVNGVIEEQSSHYMSFRESWSSCQTQNVIQYLLSQVERASETLGQCTMFLKTVPVYCA